MLIKNRIVRIKDIENEPGERWKMIYTVTVDNKKYYVRNVYYISNKGRLYNKTREKFYKPWSRGKSKNGQQYLAIQLNIRDEKKKITVQMHRLVAQYFVPGMSDIRDQIDHIDCDKTNNDATNLEWVSNTENHMRARNNNLIRGVFYSRMDDSLVHEICKLFEKGKRPDEVRVILNLSSEYTEAMRRIAKKDTWTRISKYYLFNFDTKSRHTSYISNEIIESICQLITEGYSNEYILNKYPILEKKYKNPNSLINDIKNSKVHKQISSKYF